VLTDGTLWGVLGGYGVLRFLHSAAGAQTKRLLWLLKAVLTVIAFFLVAAVFGARLSDSVQTCRSIAAANTGAANLTPTWVFLFLRWAVQVFAAVLDIAVLLAARDLVDELMHDRYSAETVAAAQKLSARAVRQISMLTAVQILLALLQLVFARILHGVDISFSLSLGSLALGLALLLFGRFAAGDARLKEENDLFI